jgi:DNA-binding NarL/FixJ family response regulator
MTQDGRAMLRVVVADDQAAVREGLVTLLDLLPDVEVVGAAADGYQALDLVARLAPDVVLMDLRMPGMDGAEAIHAIHSGHPATKVVVLTTYTDDNSVLEALTAGALGYLTKDSGRDDIARALHSAAAGQAVLDPAAHTHLLAATTAPEPVPGSDAAGAEGTAGPPALLPDRITPREAEVLGCIAVGLSNSEIAQQLFISENTVKSHINHLFAKIGVTDRAQAVGYAYQHGLRPSGRGDG